MGHTRLGIEPKSRKWKHVLDIFAEEVLKIDDQESKKEAISQISEETLEAAENGLEEAKNDQGLSYTYYLLTQLALSGKRENWEERLENIGIHVSDDTSIIELTAQFQNTIDQFLSQKNINTDISEIALQSVGEAVNQIFKSKTNSLFDANKESIQKSIKSISTKRGFSRVGRTFFSQFMTRFLNFYLSRISAFEASSNFTANEISNFNKQLNEHCYQSSYIVEDFCGEWFSKTEWEEGINHENTSRFLAVALDKMKSELKQKEG